MFFDVVAFSGPGQTCPCCHNDNLYTKNIIATPELAQRGLESVHASRCFGCGDVRLDGSYWDEAERLNRRGELDYLALVMTEIAAEDGRGTVQ